jgi:hypothetical protein
MNLAHDTPPDDRRLASLKNQRHKPPHEISVERMSFAGVIQPLRLS